MKIKGKKILKYTLITIVSLLLVLIGFIFSLRIPSVQNFVKDKLVVFLEKKIQTKVSLDRVYIDFPNSLVLENLYLQGQEVDTLLAVKSLDVGLHIPKLLNNTADITSVNLKGVRAHVIRAANGTFNFQYIIDAFATKDEEERESKPFIISLDKINLEDIGVTFTDRQAGNDIKFYLNTFATRVKTFDLENNTYAVDKISLDGLRLKLQQDLVTEVAQKVEEKVDSLSQQKPLKIKVNSIDFTHFNVDYNDDITKTNASILFAELSTKIKTLDFEKNVFEVDQIALKKANIKARLFLPAQKNDEKPDEERQTETSLPLQLKVNHLLLEDVLASYDNTAVQPLAKGIDFNHLDFSRLHFEMTDFVMQKQLFSGKIIKTEITEKSGLNINRLATRFLYSNKEAYLKELVLETPQTLLQDEIALRYSSTDQLTENLGDVMIEANLKKSKIALSDLLILAPQLQKTPPFSTYKNAVLTVDAQVKGIVDDLTVDTFKVSGIDKTVVNVSGHIKNATRPSELWFDVNVKEFTSSANTVMAILPKNTLPTTIALPPQFRINGKAKGTASNLKADLTLSSTFGKAVVQAVIDMRRKHQEVYAVKADLQQLDVGKFIKNPTIGPVSGTIAASGESFNPEKADAKVNARIASAYYNNYTYQHLDINGTVNNGQYDVKINSKDPAALLALQANGVFTKEQSTIALNGRIEKLDIHKTGFYENPLIIAGTIDADFQNLDPDALNGYLHLNDFALSDTKEIIPVSDMKLEAVANDSINQIKLLSQIADVELNGKYRLTQIFGSVQQTINQYYQFQKPADTKEDNGIDPHQHFTLNARIKNDDLIQKFVPELTSFETVILTGTYDADTKKIEIDGNIPKLTYGKNTIEHAVLKVNNTNEALQYGFVVDALQSESMAVRNIAIQGNVANNTISYDISTKDEKKEVQYQLAGIVKSFENSTQIALNENGLRLNYENWKVNPENMIQFSDQGILAQHFIITNKGSQIGVQSQTVQPNSPIEISIKDFKIESITEIIKKDSLLAKGTINGSAQLHDIKNNMTFTSDLKVDHLTVYGSKVGNLAVKVDNTTTSRLNADVTLSGFNNNMKLSGFYNTSQQLFDLEMNIEQLQMESLQGFSMNAITNAQGYVSGRLQIKGTADDPDIIGKLKFNEVGLNVTQLGTSFKDINDAIAFTEEGLQFNRFKISDEEGNALMLNGKIMTKTYRDYAFALTVNGRDFKIVNAEKSDNQMMYGVMAIDANLNIRGDINLPKVDGRLTVTDKTDFTFVLPQSSPGLQEREGIVEFIDEDQIALQHTIKTDTVSSQSTLKGMDVSVNIELNKDAKLSIVIDKANGDFIKLQGEAELTGGIDPSGKTTLVGRYEVNEGAYEMSVNILKRKFDIQKGSAITWTGEPMKADVDITAVYKTNAAPIDLIEQQIAGKNDAQLNMYKQRMPFNTLLKMKGELLKPEITFDITTDENNPTVSSDVLNDVNAKLAQLRTEESEMNKQVFALLLLNRFIGENPFESSAGMSAESIARQSVSKILSQQLNNLAADLIAGVELNFDLESTDDYSSGEKNTRTDLNVGVSKKLFDDRLKVSVGSNFGLEGQERPNEKMTNIAGNVTFDYALSKDGRYTLRAYRKDEYQVALQGQIVETGLGFIITIDYNKFKEIFESQKSKREFRRNQRNEKKNEKTK